MNDDVKKRCARCGWVGMVRPARRRCHQPKFGLGSYACWGVLARVSKPLEVAMRTAEKVLDGAASYVTPTEAAAHLASRQKRPQDVAAQKLAHARKQVAEKTRAMKRLVTSLRLWERRAQKYAKKASLTDAEIEQARATRKAKAEARAATRIKRGMKVGGAA